MCVVHVDLGRTARRRPVTVYMRAGSTLKVNGTCTFVDRPPGRAQYTWTPVMLLTTGGVGRRPKSRPTSRLIDNKPIKAALADRSRR